jgi:hypothetical protein
MKMTLDPDLVAEAKAMVVLTFRNAPSKTCMRGSPALFAAVSPRSPISPTTR